MSGYLQRMALSVLKPEVAIHPVVGSIFSAPKPRDSLESILELENVSSNQRELSRETSSTGANSSTSAASSTRDAHGTPQDPNVARSMRPAPVTPSVDTSGDRLSRPPDTARSASVKPDRSVTDDRRADLSALVAGNDATPANPVMRRFAPLMPAVISPSPQPVISRSPVKPTDDAARPFASRSRANDDIEIHIGRIEVAAVQAAPIRSASAKPARRAASLDEYLKRRDGIV